MYKLNSVYQKILSDTLTPVSIYLKLRDKYPNSILLESSDYHANDNNFSYICCNPIAHIKVDNNQIEQLFPDGSKTVQNIASNQQVVQSIHKFSQSFKTNLQDDFKFITSGIFGYMCYDAVKYFEDIEVGLNSTNLKTPEIYYAIYQNIISINHRKNEAHIFSHTYQGNSNLEEILNAIQAKPGAQYHFKKDGGLTSNVSDNEYKEMVEKAKQHCARGDVFQLVLSKQFSQAFKGDDFNVYRALRNINPSPYLFYFDYGTFKIFGSSPEAQLVIKDRKAEIHPIAGTFKRTGNDLKDSALAKELLADEKENAEHTMLVDLARNDLSRNGKKVSVDTYKEVQFFSHVIHLVSKVVAEKDPQTSSLQIVADTFPAGTLSGAPKHMAMQLIEKYEPTARNFYGGAIGFMDFDGNFNHAIMIRSFLSQQQKLYWQAGAGLVSKSNPESELQEVYNKLGALNKALEMAENLNN